MDYVSAEKDAIQPFLTEEPAELYEQPSNVDTLFGYSSSVLPSNSYIFF